MERKNKVWLYVCCLKWNGAINALVCQKQYETLTFSCGECVNFLFSKFLPICYWSGKMLLNYGNSKDNVLMHYSCYDVG